MTLSHRARALRFALSTVSALTLFCACGGSEHTTGPINDSDNYGITVNGPGVLSVTPLDTNTLVFATPLGALAPPGHVLPTDHVYLYFIDPWNGNQQTNDCHARAVRAAGSGVVTFILQTQGVASDSKLEVRMTKTFRYYYDHVVIKPGIALATHVNAGDTVATTTGRCPSMDLGVIDDDVTPPGFINTSRYSPSTGHAVSPYKYFSEPLRTWLYAHVRLIDGVPANRDGRTDWGVRGRRVGDWFHASLAAENASVLMGSVGWAKTLAFAYDWFDNTRLRISVGGTIADPGVLKPAVGNPDASIVSVASGIVAYETTPTLGRITAGWMLVQMLADDRIKVEYFAGAIARPASFSAAAQEYVR
jgi:hypothetical protein